LLPRSICHFDSSFASAPSFAFGSATSFLIASSNSLAPPVFAACWSSAEGRPNFSGESLIVK